MAQQQFKNRIIRFGVKKADQFLANPKNPRMHPIPQREAMEEALTDVGFVAPVIETSDGYLLDGHERIYQALANNSDVPFVVLDIHSDDPEADYVLATFDPLGAMGTYDPALLDELLKAVEPEGDNIQRMLNDLWDVHAIRSYTDDQRGTRPDEQLDTFLKGWTAVPVCSTMQENLANRLMRKEIVDGLLLETRGTTTRIYFQEIRHSFSPCITVTTSRLGIKGIQLVGMVSDFNVEGFLKASALAATLL